jgi:hypothetical protein
MGLHSVEVDPVKDTAGSWNRAGASQHVRVTLTFDVEATEESGLVRLRRVGQRSMSPMRDY